MEQEILDRINKRLEALEVVHTRYTGPRGRDGAPAKVCVGKVEVGDTASVKVRQLDGNVFELSFVLPRGQELEALREERAEFREEKNNFRKELYEFQTALSKELQELYERTALIAPHPEPLIDGGARCDGICFGEQDSVPEK